MDVFFCSNIDLFTIQPRKHLFIYRFVTKMRKVEYLVNFSIVFLFLLCSAFAVQAGEILQFEHKGNNERVIINSANLNNHKVFMIQNPERLVVDIPSLPGKNSFSLPSSYKGKIIKSVRFAQFNPKTSRFVFDLNEKIKVVSVKNDKKKKLVISISAKAVSQKSANVPQAKNSEISKPSKTPKKVKANIPPLIVIDAGHGGVDPGAIGESGTQEKDLVLWYAKALKSKLLKLNKYRILLTRSDDKYITLRERIAIARRANASMFISLHADSANEQSARGISVYTVSEQASDKEAEALAARENKSDIIGGMDLSGARPDVADILISLAQRETKNNSATLADLLVIHLDDRVRTVPSPHRFAGFAVLKAPDIPSVLVEIGFLSNAQEEKELRSKIYRDKVIDGITVGVESYFRKKSAMGTSN